MKIDINVPNGVSGDWIIDTITVKNNELGEMMSMMQTGRSVPAGIYKRLKRCETTVMSNTPDEIRDFTYVLSNLSGSVLINGLGLGVTVKFLLDNENITKVTVIEKSEDVIKLVSPAYLSDSRFNVVHADCFEYIPPKGERYSFVWHDIWDNICADNLDEMKKLHRKYGRKCDSQASWCRYECEAQRRRDMSYNYY